MGAAGQPRTYGSLLVDYFVDDTVVINNERAGGGGGMFELAGNKPPEFRVEGPLTRSVEVTVVVAG